MSTHLTAGALRFIRRDVVAVPGVVAPRQQETPPTVMAAPGSVAPHQSPVKVSKEKGVELPELRLLDKQRAVLVVIEHYLNEFDVRLKPCLVCTRRKNVNLLSKSSLQSWEISKL